MPSQTLLRLPRGIAFDGLGAYYIGDTTNAVVRKVTGGLIYLVAGLPFSTGFSGDLGPALAAKLNQPMHIAYDASSGGIYISDYANHVRLRSFQVDARYEL